MSRPATTMRLACGGLLILCGLLVGPCDPRVMMLVLPLAAICLRGLAIVRHPWIGGWDMCWLSFLVFFVVGPLQSVGGWAFHLEPLAPLTYGAPPFIVAMVIVIMLALPLLVVQELGAARTAITGATNPWLATVQPSLMPMLLGLFVATWLCYIPAAGGFGLVLASRIERDESGAWNPLSFLLLAHLVVLASLLVRRATAGPAPSRLHWGIPLLVCGMLLVVSNPFNVPRNQLVITWLPVVLSLTGRYGSTLWIYPAALLTAHVVFPVLSTTTRHGTEALGQLSESLGHDAFVIPQLDAFDTLVHAVWVHDSLKLAPQECTLAALFFFVPRALWPDKPIIGSLHVGGDLKRYHLAGTDNLSFFPGGDWYLDGGLFQAALLSGLTALLLWLALRGGGASSWRLLAPLLVGSVPILLRGAVGAVVGYPFCIAVVAGVYAVVLNRRLDPAEPPP